MQVGVVEAHLEGMGAGDVGHRRAVVEIPVPRVVVGGGRAIRQRRARDRVEGVADRDHARLQVIDVAQLAHLRLHAAPALDAVDAAGLDQQPVADRRVPVHVTKRCSGNRRSLPASGELTTSRVADRRPSCRRRSSPGRRLMPILCLGLDLPRQARLVDRLLLVEDRLVRRSHVVEAIQLVRVLVEEHAGDVVVGEELSARTGRTRACRA